MVEVNESELFEAHGLVDDKPLRYFAGMVEIFLQGLEADGAFDASRDPEIVALRDSIKDYVTQLREQRYYATIHIPEGWGATTGRGSLHTGPFPSDGSGYPVLTPVDADIDVPPGHGLDVGSAETGEVVPE